MPDYRQMARAAAIAAGYDPELFVRQIGAESGFNPRAGSPAGARGIAQIMPATARGWGVDPMDPKASLHAAARAMSKYLKSYDGDYAKALAAYNAGTGAVKKYNGVPPYKETRNYIKKILGPGGRAPASGPQAGSQGPATAAAGGSDPILERIFAKNGLSPVTAGLLAQSDAPDVPAPMSMGGGDMDLGGGKSLDQLTRLAKRFNLPITSTTGGKHAPGSYHYQSRAVDMGLGPGGKRLAALARANPGKFKEFFGPMNWHIKNGVIKPGAFPDHSDHYHAAR
jgi:hypothetical protein